MKNIFNISTLKKGTLVGSMCILLFSSCAKDDLLNRNDLSNVDEGKAWTTPYLTKLGMNGVYSALRQGVDRDNSATCREIYQFDQFGIGNTLSNSARREIIWGGSSASNDIFKEVWKDLYEGVSRSCDAIVNIPTKSQCDEDIKNTYVAEAKFLRAFFYFRLNQLYKGVPIYDTPPTVDDCMRLRSSEQEVWNFIIKDLTDCINEPKLKDKYAKGDSDYGKVTKGAAYALRGKTYLYIGEWQKAIEDFDAVEKCGYSLFKGNFKELFTVENEQCNEMIFSLQNVEVNYFGSSIHFHAGTRSSWGECWNTVALNASVVDAFENADGSEFDWEKIIPGYTAMKPLYREVYFLRDTLGLRDQLFTTGYFKTIGDAGERATSIRTSLETRLKKLPAEIQALYLPSGNEARIRKAYENRDPRLEQSVITPYAKYLGVLSKTEDHLVTMRWPYSFEAKGVDDLRSDNNGDLYYFNRKFVHEGNTLTVRGASPIDFPIIRYADVLLMKAEAYAELNKISEGVACVNAVRERAGLATLNSSIVTTVNSKDDLVKRVRNERKVEFLNEGLSYFDFLRWGIWKQEVFTVDKHGNEPGRQHCYGDAQRAYTYDGDKLLKWPIPSSEVEMNAGLTQNEGW